MASCSPEGAEPASAALARTRCECECECVCVCVCVWWWWGLPCCGWWCGWAGSGGCGCGWRGGGRGEGREWSHGEACAVALRRAARGGAGPPASRGPGAGGGPAARRPDGGGVRFVRARWRTSLPAAQGAFRHWRRGPGVSSPPDARLRLRRAAGAVLRRARAARRGSQRARLRTATRFGAVGAACGRPTRANQAVAGAISARWRQVRLHIHVRVHQLGHL